MITPACDVSQYKTETLTYLPVVSLNSYFTSPAFLVECRRRILELYEQAEVSLSLDWQKSGYALPRAREIRAETEKLSKLREQAGKKQRILDSAIAGFNLVNNAVTCEPSDENAKLVAALFDKTWPTKIESIIKNSFRSDIHFLPATASKPSELAICRHSVALLRYPITIPIEWLDEAQRSDSLSWINYLTSNSRRSILLSEADIPIKIASLEGRFGVSLLSRYTALFSRVGAPDFSNTTIKKIAAEVTR